MTVTAVVRSYAEILDRSLQAVRTDVPDAHSLMIDALGDRVFSFLIDDELFTLGHSGVMPSLAATRGPILESARLTITSTELCDLLDGRTSLYEQVHQGSVQLHGTTHDLAALDRVMVVLLHGLVRSPCAPTLMETVRSLAAHRIDNASLEENR